MAERGQSVRCLRGFAKLLAARWSFLSARETAAEDQSEQPQFFEVLGLTEGSLLSHPELAAALEEFQAHTRTVTTLMQPSETLCSGTQDAESLELRHRVQEVLQNERRRSAADLLQNLVLFEFSKMEVRPMDTLRTENAEDMPQQPPVDLKRLATGLYSKDALDLVREHVLSIIGDWEHLSRDFPLLLALYQVGQVYAASAIFGYSLRLADVRYQLEKLAFSESWEAEGVTKGLRDYVKTFGLQELHLSASVKSAEAAQAMTSQVAKLVGDMAELKGSVAAALSNAVTLEEATESLREAIQHGDVASVKLTVADLRRLCLEGVGFGFLLGAAETKVDGIVELTPNQQKCPMAWLGLDVVDTSPCEGHPLSGFFYAFGA